MAKQGNQTSGKPVDVEGLFREAEGLGHRAASGIDELLKNKAEIMRAAEDRAGMIDEQIDRLNELYRTATGKNYINPSKGKDGGKGEGKGRRSADQLKQQATELAEFIKSKGKDGATAAEVKGRFGKIIPSVKEFLGKYGDGAKVKLTGERSGTVYHID